MAKLHFGSKGNHSVAAAGAIGAVIALVISVLLSVLLTNLVLKERVTDTVLVVAMFAMRTISVLVGCLVCSLLTDGKLLQVICIAALGYLLILLAAGIVLFDSSFQGFGYGLLSVIVGAAIAIVIQSMTLHSNKRKKIRRK